MAITKPSAFWECPWSIPNPWLFLIMKLPSTSAKKMESHHRTSHRISSPKQPSQPGDEIKDHILHACLWKSNFVGSKESNIKPNMIVRPWNSNRSLSPLVPHGTGRTHISSDEDLCANTITNMIRMTLVRNLSVFHRGLGMQLMIFRGRKTNLSRISSRIGNALRK